MVSPFLFLSNDCANLYGEDLVFRVAILHVLFKKSHFFTLKIRFGVIILHTHVFNCLQLPYVDRVGLKRIESPLAGLMNS